MAASRRIQRSPATACGAYVALLRGVNVGGKNPLPMADLRAIFEGAGCVDVETYIQSGNVLFSASSAVVPKLSDAVADSIAKRFKVRVPVILRSAAELAAAAAENPYLRRAADTKCLHVVFLADRPAAERVAALDPNRSPGDSFAVQGREIFLHLPNGAARSKLTNSYFDSTFATISTVRNWRTVQKLVELAVARS